MAEKIVKEVPNKKGSMIDDLFDEVKDELNEDVIKAAKIKIKTLLEQKMKAEKVVKNLDRQIDDLRLQISQELG